MKVERIELFIEGQGFGSFSIPFPLLPSVSTTERYRKTEKDRQLAVGRRGGGVEDEPNHPTA